MTTHHATALGCVLAAAVAGGCATEDDEPQRIDGRIERAGFEGTVDGVRVVTGDGPISTAPLGADDRFTIALPDGVGYRFEVVTSSVSHPVAVPVGGRIVVQPIDVCQSADPFDIGLVVAGDVDDSESCAPDTCAVAERWISSFGCDVFLGE